MQEFGNSSKSYLLELTRLTKYNLIACGYEKLIVSGATAQKLISIPNDARYMELSLESSITATVPVRYLMLGTPNPPTTTNGLPLRDGTFFDITGRPNMENFRAIEATAGTNVIHIQYYK